MRTTPSDRTYLRILDTFISWVTLTHILVVAALLRVLSIALIRNYIHPNTWEFGEIARNLVSGYGYRMRVNNPSAHMPPLYPYLLSGLWKLAGDSPAAYLGLELFQAFLGVLLVLVVYRLTLILSSRGAALTAATIVAIWPSFIYLCNEVHSISIYTLLGVSSVYYLVRYVEVSRSWKDIVGLGLTMGGLLLCRAEAVLLLFIYAGILLWRCGRSSMVQAVASCLIAGACLAPWTIRNYRSLDRFVLVTTSGGFNLWVGHNEHAAGNSDYSLDNLRPEQQALLDHEPLGPDLEIRRSHRFTTFAVDFIRSHPATELRLALRKLFFFVLFDPTHAKGRSVSYWLPSLILTVLAGYGAWVRRRTLFRQYLPLTATVAVAIVLSIVVFALPRYRITIDPFLVIFAANAITFRALAPPAEA